MGAPSGQVGCHRSSVCSDWRILGKCDVPNRAFGEIARKGLTPSCRCAPRKPSSSPAKAPQRRTTRPGGAEAQCHLVFDRKFNMMETAADVTIEERSLGR